MSAADPTAPEFLAAARRHVVPPAILVQHPSLTPPGAETGRLEGRGSLVLAMAVLLDGRLVAGDALGRLHWLTIVA